MDAMIQVVEDCILTKDRKYSVFAIFFDFVKAFDILVHEVLLQKLEKQLPIWLVSWIAAYLINRKQRVFINSTCTDWKAVEAGVIYGNVLGPILFVLINADINDQLLKNCEL